MENGKLKVESWTTSHFARIILGGKSTSLLEPVFRHYAFASARLKSVCLSAWLQPGVSWENPECELKDESGKRKAEH
ncbi:MAG: hypothetical protein VZR56_11690 [Treponema sp.]|nr:hypothetical protein [Treponema sp.]